MFMRNLWTDMGFRNAAYRVHRFEVWQMHLHTHPHSSTYHHTHMYILTVHIHSQSEGVRSCNIACCNLVHSTVITSDVSNSQTSSSDSDLWVTDGVPFLVKVMLSTLELASSRRENVNSCSSVGVVAAVVHENHGEQWWRTKGTQFIHFGLTADNFMNTNNDID